MRERIEALLEQMTLEEKASMAAGADMWHSTGVERLGIPPFKMTDGPNGARGAQMTGGVGAACFPVGICLASTWNTELLRRVGVALGEEVKTKSAHVLLGPTVNIHRSPLNGRNFECYSEDPYLAARLAVAYIEGVQSQGVGACIKHFVCNDSEFERMSISSEVGERALREIYLPPFRAAVREAGVWSVMGAYNKLNGTHCCENSRLLNDILKEEWGFEGIVISDWTGTKSTVAAANGGLDLEMPGTARYMGEALLKAVQEGQVPEAAIDDKVRRLLRVVLWSGAIDHPEEPERAVDRPEHRALIREAAGEGIVLLKNEGGILPLDASAMKKIAVIGPNAKTAAIMGGGSSQVNAHYVVSPLEGIQARFGDEARVTYEPGCSIHKATPTIDASWLTPSGGREGPGLTIEYMVDPDLTGDPVLVDVASGLQLTWFGQFSTALDPSAFSARLTGSLRPPETGTYVISLASAGRSRLYLDGQEIIDNWTEQVSGDSFFGMGSAEVKVKVDLVAGRAYDLRIEYSKEQRMPLGGLIVGCLPVVPGDPMARAVHLAARSDVALVFIGTNGEWESEGFDRADMELPGRQVELLDRVAAANPNTIAILNTGSPISMSWLDRVPAVLEAWFPGQECGHAIADVLFGDVNPSGRLPQTFPVRLEDNPAYINYPGENGKVLYGEGIWVGYRYYDRKKIAPRFPFGYGLSYTTFEYGSLAISPREGALDEPVDVSVDVTNTGDRAGKEVVQLYLRDVASSLARPEKELKGFAKVSLEPGETRTVHLTLGRDALSFYDDLERCWVAEAGEFEVLLGSSSRNIRVRDTFVLRAPPKDERAATGRPEGGAGLSIHSSLRDIVGNPDGEAVLKEHLGPLADSPGLAMGMDMTLEEVAEYVPDLLTPEILEMIDADLRSL